ncbi:MAG: hypothetical protein IT162_06230 [Bryobacterales bacterium]|nr:hypothetical protein [Bryobacterales bacterium]
MPWSALQLAGFRFLFSYLALYWLPVLYPLWSAAVPVFGKWLGVEAVRRANGSGDTMFHWVQILAMLTLALIAAAVWSALDRRRTQYTRLYLGLRVGVRLLLGMTLISYGSFKLIQSQFPPPGLFRLDQSLGEFSPMGLLWTFMGASRGYNVITGLAEAIPGVLLFFPRTTLAGALIAAGVMVNVVALNFCYDVPVKQFSLHLLAMALFLAAHDARRLAGFFFDPAAPPPPAILNPRLQRVAFWLKCAVLLAFTAMALIGSHRQAAALAGNAEPWPAVRGVWEVREYSAADRAAGSVPEIEQWRQAIFDDQHRQAVILWGNHTRGGFKLQVEEKAGRLSLNDFAFTFTRSGPDDLRLEGTIFSRAVVVKLKRNTAKTRLTTRGFHWVNEVPFNR